MKRYITLLLMVLCASAYGQIRTNLAGPGVYGTLPVTKGGTGYAAANIAALKVYLGLGMVADAAKELSNDGIFTYDGVSSPARWTSNVDIETEGSFRGDGSALTGITGAGFGTQTANTVLVGPATGAAAAPTFRTLVAADIPSTIPTLAAANAFTNANTFTRTTGTAVSGTSSGPYSLGIYGTGDWYGVHGMSTVGSGVYGSGAIYGVHGSGISSGIYGQSSSGDGVHGESITANGISGLSSSGIGVLGTGGLYGTIADLNANTGTNTAWADGDNTKLWFAQKFTAGATATAQAVSLKLAKLNATAPLAAASTITAYIHADSTGAVGSVLTGGKGTSIRFDAITSTDQTEFYFGGMSAALTSGTAYWIVVKASAFETSAGSIVHDSTTGAIENTYATYNLGTATWSYSTGASAIAAWCKVHVAGGVGLSGTSTINHGVTGASTVGYGVSGTSTRSVGVYGYSPDNVGVYGESGTSVGVWAKSVSGNAIYGITTHALGAYIQSTYYPGIHGVSFSSTAIQASQSGTSYATPAFLVQRGGTGYGPLIRAESYGTVANATSGNGTSNLDALLVTGGVGGASSYNTGVGGAGAGVALTGGAGGASTNATAGTGGVGGGHEFIAGKGGASTAGVGGTGGGFNVTLGGGGAGATIGGKGGSVVLTGGIGGYADSGGTGGEGGDITLTPGIGGAADTNGATGHIYLSGLRDAADDTAAAALTPPVPTGALYRNGSILMIRVE